MLYRLGTAIQVAGAKAGPIAEFEFSARTYRDIEDVRAASDNQIAQAVALIRQVARPTEIDSLQFLPDWALRQITVGDGVTIAKQILPRF